MSGLIKAGWGQLQAKRAGIAVPEAQVNALIVCERVPFPSRQRWRGSLAPF